MVVVSVNGVGDLESLGRGPRRVYSRRMGSWSRLPYLGVGARGSLVGLVRQTDAGCGWVQLVSLILQAGRRSL